ncbi:MAG: hypothetical protein J6L85_01240 [Clostridia bacterium]|nr:hypothetical protein [Clostridia bacterium]
MDHGRVSNKKTSKKLIRVLVILSIALVALALISAGVLYFLNNYVFFPRADKALSNALRAKLDFDTKFDARDMLEQGSLELTADNTGDFERIEGSVLYGKRGAAARLFVDGSEIEVAVTGKGAALGSPNVNDGQLYGVTFADASKNLEGSFLNPENNSEYALAQNKYEILRKLATKLEEVKEGKGEYAKDASAILDAIKTAADEKPLYSKVKNYDEVEIGGELRDARSITYSFDHASVTGFLGSLADVFEEPTPELEDAVARLLEGGFITDTFKEKLGVKLEDCGDTAELIDDLARLMEVFLGKDGWEGRLVFAYVNDAFSAIQFSLKLGARRIYALVDFGEKPKSDKNMVVKTVDEIYDSKQNLIKKTENTAEYGVDAADGKTNINMLYMSAVTKNGEYAEQSYTVSAVLDRESRNATLRAEKLENNGVSEQCTAICDLSFEMVDKYSSLSFDGGACEGPERYTLVLKKRSGNLMLPKYEELLKMSVEDADAVISRFKKEFEPIMNFALSFKKKG